MTTPAGTRIRWGLGDVVTAWALGFFAAALAAVVAGAVAGLEPGDETPVWLLLAVIVAQSVTQIGVLAVVAELKGRGSLAVDFGLRVRARDWAWFAAGVGVNVALLVVTVPMNVLAPDEAQGVVERFEDARGLETVLFALAVVVLAPVTEELVFRGALLRALLRRTTPAWAVVVQAGAFAAVHPLFDPGLGSLKAVPALATLGVVAGYQAVKTGDLSRSILLHGGFNALTAVAILAGA